MAVRGRRRSRTALALAVLALGGVLAACVPEPDAAPPPTQSAPEPADVFVVYGDSLADEAVPVLRRRLEALLPGWEIVFRTQSGAAQCDVHGQMVRDAAELPVAGVLIGYTGNRFTPCISNRDWADGYRTDASWAVTFWRSHGVEPVLVAGPAAVGVAHTGADDVIANVYRSVGVARDATVVDPAYLFADSTGLFAEMMPCFVDECGGTIRVRDLVGVHLCLVPGTPGGCTVYSSGVERYAEAAVHGVATALHLAQPPYRAMREP